MFVGVNILTDISFCLASLALILFWKNILDNLVSSFDLTVVEFGGLCPKKIYNSMHQKNNLNHTFCEKL